MEKNQKKGMHFDEKGFEERCKQIEYHAGKVAEAVRTLKAEGIDVSAKELNTYPERFGDFVENDGKEYKAHFVALYKQAESRAGWLPMAERQRMFDNFIGVFKRTISAATDITNAINFGCVISDLAEGAAVDIEATEKEHKKQFIIGVDADAMATHWRMLNELRDKIQEPKSWEAKQKMPILSVTNVYDFGSFAHYVNNMGFGEGDPIMLTEEMHNKTVCSYFKTDKK